MTALPLTAEDVLAIREAADVPEDWLQHREDGTVLVTVPSDAPYESVDRLLVELKRRCPLPSMSFVGNEAPCRKPREKPE